MGLSDFSFSIAMRDTIGKMIENTVDSMRPGPRYGIVDTIDRLNRQCGVILNGDTDPVLVPMGSVQPMTTGQTVRVAGPKGDRYVEDVIGSVYVDNLREKWISRAQFMCTHGGVGVGPGIKTVTSSGIWWSGRFLFLGQGVNNQLAGYTAGGGFFEVNYPATGTVIPKYLNKITNNGLDYRTATADSSVTVTATSIPLNGWDTLWYVPPWGTTAVAGISANFRITEYINTEYVIPSDWIMIAHRNGDTGVVKWADGVQEDYTHSFSYVNAYGDYSDATYGPPGWRRSGEFIYMTGLISGSANASFTIANMPVGARPDHHQIFSLMSSSGARELRVNSDGSMFYATALAASGWCSLAGVIYRSAT